MTSDDDCDVAAGRARPEERAALEQRVAAVLRFARFSGPTGDIDQLLAEIERGRSLA